MSRSAKAFDVKVASGRTCGPDNVAALAAKRCKVGFIGLPQGLLT
jgi:hypothetical protein